MKLFRWKFRGEWWKTYGWCEVMGYRLAIFRSTYNWKNPCLMTFPPFIIKIFRPNS